MDEETEAPLGDLDAEQDDTDDDETLVGRSSSIGGSVVTGTGGRV